MNKLLVNHKNLSEILACAGLCVLGDCLGSSIKRCRFTGVQTTHCEDDVFRSFAFEFEHDDYSGLLNRIAALTIEKVSGKVKLVEREKEIMTLDWCDMGGFLGDSGNFSKADKSGVVSTHHQVFADLVDEADDLFARSTELDTMNFFTNWNCLKKNYVDAGGVYDSADRGFYAREFPLIVALQNFRNFMTRLTSDKVVEYNVITHWMTPTGLYALLAANKTLGKRMQASASNFGNYGLVLKSATELSVAQAVGV
jgi:hypothetical protein